MICFIISFAQEMSVPAKLQYQIFLKILTFDRNLRERVSDEIVIGIIYQSNFRKSWKVREEIVEAINESPEKKLGDIPIRYVTINLSGENDLKEIISRNKVDILYITPIRAFDLRTITVMSRAKKILTLTGVTDYVELGIAVGLGLKRQKPQIIINLTAAKAEGSNFSSKLLNLAKIVGSEN